MKAARSRKRWAVLFFVDGMPAYVSGRDGKLAWSYRRGEAEKRSRACGYGARVVDADDFVANTGKYLREMNRARGGSNG